MLKSRYNIFLGPAYLLRGYQLLFTKGLKRYVIIPVLINTLIFTLALWIGFHWIGRLSELLPHALHFFKIFFDMIYFLMVSFLFVYVFTIATNLMGAPFNSFLSAKVERMISIEHLPTESRGILHEIKRTIKREGRKGLYYLPRLLGVLILFFIPGVNMIAGILWFLLSAWIMAIEYFDYPMDNKKESFDATRAFIRKNFIVCFSFGITVSVAAMIPIVNFMVVPAAVIGATCLYKRVVSKASVI